MIEYWDLLLANVLSFLSLINADNWNQSVFSLLSVYNTFSNTAILSSLLSCIMVWYNIRVTVVNFSISVLWFITSINLAITCIQCDDFIKYTHTHCYTEINAFGLSCIQTVVWIYLTYRFTTRANYNILFQTYIITGILCIAISEIGLDLSPKDTINRYTPLSYNPKIFVKFNRFYVRD